jgi:hypothetical protein
MRIYASIAERRPPLIDSIHQVLEKSHRVGVEFLLTDMRTGMTFLDIAEVTQSSEVRDRNRRNARLAYDTVVRIMSRLSPTAEERSNLENGLSELRQRLIAVGYAPDPEQAAGNVNS